MNSATDFSISRQVFWLLILAIPVACVAWTVVYEEVFREPREWCKRKSQSCDKLLQRKFFYLFTCEYCFSHYVTIFAIAATNFQLLLPGWRGYMLALFALVFVANIYMNLYARLRVDIKAEKKAIEHKEKAIEATEKDIEHKEKQIQKLDEELAGTSTR